MPRAARASPGDGRRLPYTITCAPGTLSAANYSFRTGSTATLSITKAALSVNADPASKTYGDADPAFTYTFSGFQFSGETRQLSITGSGRAAAGPPGQSGGRQPYTITCAPGTLSAANYSFRDRRDRQLRDQPPGRCRSTPTPRPKTYGAADPTFTYGFSGFARRERRQRDDRRCRELQPRRRRGDGRRLPVHDHVCPGDLVGRQLQLRPAPPAPSRSTKAALSVNADPASKTYGDADPAFTYTFSGFQFSDDASNSGITGAADCSPDLR